MALSLKKQLLRSLEKYESVVRAIYALAPNDRTPFSDCAAWDHKDKNRWWDGSRWNIRAKRRTYDDYERTQILAAGFPPDGAWRETGEKPYWSNSGEFAGYTADRENGARKRLAKIMAQYPTLQAYVQGDPRGASLYILRPGDVPEGEKAESYYNRGVAVYK